MINPAKLRPATEEDAIFLQRVYRSTREEELTLVPWSEEQKDAFIEMQFRAQDADYRRNYPNATRDVILRDGIPSGRLYVDRRESEISILDIALLPEHRGAGLGTILLRELMDESDRTGRALEIYVEKYNRAQTLYRRLGFAETDENGVYWRMVRPAAAR